MQPNILSFPEVQSIVFCGDIHGDFIALVDKLRQTDIHDALIVVYNRQIKKSAFAK